MNGGSAGRRWGLRRQGQRSETNRAIGWCGLNESDRQERGSVQRQCDRRTAVGQCTVCGAEMIAVAAGHAAACLITAGMPHGCIGAVLHGWRRYPIRRRPRTGTACQQQEQRTQCEKFADQRHSVFPSQRNQFSISRLRLFEKKVNGPASSSIELFSVRQERLL